MKFSATTRYRSNASGRGGIVVKTAAGQRTIPFEHAARDAHLEALRVYVGRMFGTTLMGADEIGPGRAPGSRLWEVETD